MAVMPVPTSAQAANLRATLKTEGVKLAARGVDIPPEMLANLAQATKESGLTRAVTRGSVGRTDITALTKQISIMSANLSRADKDTVALASALRANKAYEGIRSVIRASGANVPETLNKYMRSMQGRLGVLTGGKDATDLLAKIAQSSETTRKDMDKIVRGGGGSGGVNPFLFTRIGAQLTGSKTLANAPQMHGISSALFGKKGGILGTLAALVAGLTIESPGLVLDLSAGVQKHYQTFSNYLNSSAQLARFGGMGANTNLMASGPNITNRTNLSNMALNAISPQFANPTQFLNTANLSRIPLRNPKEITNFVSAIAQLSQQGPTGLGGLQNQQYASTINQLQQFGFANRGGNVVSPNAMNAFNNVFGRVMERSVQMGMDKSAAVEAIQQGINVMANGGGTMYKSMPGTLTNAFLGASGTFSALRNPGQAVSSLQGLQAAGESSLGNPALLTSTFQWANSLPGKGMRQKLSRLGPKVRRILQRFPNAPDAMLPILLQQAGALTPFDNQIMQFETRGMGLPRGAGYTTEAIMGTFNQKEGAASVLAAHRGPMTGGAAGVNIPTEPTKQLTKFMTPGARQILSRYNHLLLSNPASAQAYLKTIMSSKNPDMMNAAKALNLANAAGWTNATGNFATTPQQFNRLTGVPVPGTATTTLTAQGQRYQQEIAIMATQPQNAEALRAFSFNKPPAAGQINTADMQNIALQLSGLNDALIQSSQNWFNGANGISNSINKLATAMQKGIRHVAPNAPKNPQR